MTNWIAPKIVTVNTIRKHIKVTVNISKDKKRTEKEYDTKEKDWEKRWAPNLEILDNIIRAGEGDRETTRRAANLEI